MIPLSVPHIAGNEWEYVKRCLDSGWVSSAGSFVDDFEQKIAQYTGAKHAIATASGTAALHTALILAGVQQNDLVIIPNLTFAATANAVRYLHADPILCDVRHNTWQLDLDLLDDWLATQTKIKDGVCIHRDSGRKIPAIIPVHVLGNMVDMEKLKELATAYQLTIVEDAAEALGSFWGTKHAGTIGKIGCLSFNGNKIMTTGGGGMILTDDDDLAKRALHLTRQAKTDPVEYDHDEVGFNYRLSNVSAAIGVAQLEQIEAFLTKKRNLAVRYREAFSDISGIFLQQKTLLSTTNHWLFTIGCERSRELMAHLDKHGIQSRPLWRPMNQLPMYRECMYISEQDVAGILNKACLSIPCSSNLSEEDQETVIKQIREFYD
ncbi:MAG: LegC family aminotransferase [Bacteroidia bacterium]